MSDQIVIIGSGFAARQLVKNLRKQDANVPIVLIAAGASAIVPPISGHEHMLTLNSQQEYRQCEEQLLQAKRVLILGGGLIGSELAMDMCRAGKQVTVIDKSCSLLSSLMPVEASSRLQFCLQQMGVELVFNQQLVSLQPHQRAWLATLSNGRELLADAVVSSIGLRPNIQLAEQAGLQVNRGIVVDARLQTSAEDVYALGDCAEIEGKLLPFLQPIQFSAMTLAKNLLGASDNLKLPAMLVKIKTPNMPLHLAGETQRQDLQWTITSETQGMIAKGFDQQQQLRAFIVSEDHMKQAFGLLKTLQV
ncbi:NADH:flavorubredoxin oxidoreductase [Ewingella americana]|nr:NADH:flavorubredoxin oxidoreductase [Ewingella americana]